MPLNAGSRLGPYEIVSQLGAGGMGEVYKARDSRLDRTVAIKILPSHLADNPDLKQRFEREARTISSLSHPHICVLHDIGHQDGVDYLVMEFLEGETLASRLARGPLPVDQVLRYGVEIADAVDKAHRRGIVHRDLKPGNIMLTRSGAKLLDFGLAKLRRSEPAVGLSLLPTQSAPLTAEGSIVGTLQYMAPEQLEGKEAEARTDIFALGAVIYEMVTGKKAFEAESQASLIAAILDRDPAPISDVQPLAPAALDHIVRKCLVKSPDERWQSAHDLTTELQWIAEQGAQLDRSLPQKPRGLRAYVPWSLAALASVLAAILAIFYFYFAPESTAQTVRFARILPEDVPNVSTVALSPDGSQMAFVTGAGDNTRLWVHSLNSLERRQLPGTEGAILPFWSPDNLFIGFFAQGKLKKIAVAGGPALTLTPCDASWPPKGGAWSRDGIILFASREGIQRVSPAGGVSSAVTKLERSRQETYPTYPQFLPDGRSFLFAVGSREPKHAGIYVASLDSSEKRKIMDRTGFRVVYGTFTG